MTLHADVVTFLRTMVRTERLIGVSTAIPVAKFDVGRNGAPVGYVFHYQGNLRRRFSD